MKRKVMLKMIIVTSKIVTKMAVGLVLIGRDTQNSYLVADIDKRNE